MGPSKSVQNAQTNLANEQAAAASQSQQQSAQTYATTEPGLNLAESYYQAIASGDPQKIFSAVSPSVQQLIQNNAATKNQISENIPRGGAQDLAKAQSDIATSGQIGNLETSSYTSAFPALANLASSGLGISVNEMANAISGFQGAGQGMAAIGQQQAEGKASTMGFLGSIAGAGGMALAGAGL